MLHCFLENTNKRLHATLQVWCNIYIAAPEMKNHLSIVGSMGAGLRFSPAGMGGRADDSVRKGEVATVRLALGNS